jgi:hypothetical protein
MRVVGGQIHDLSMDGEVIVDSKVDNNGLDTRVGAALAGLALAVAAILAIRRRALRLIELRRPGRSSTPRG